jgi:hypothetical protein
MCTATICAFVHEIGQPCRIVDNRHQWWVHVLHCNGEIVNWCGLPVKGVQTECGQAEIRVPPGCYVVCATWSPAASATNLGNHLTHCAIVQVGCDEHVCVNLFTPSLHACGHWFLDGIRDSLTIHGALTPGGVRAAQAVETAVTAFLRELPADPFVERTANLGREPRPEGPKPPKK